MYQVKLSSDQWMQRTLQTWSSFKVVHTCTTFEIQPIFVAKVVYLDV